jgi:hypothetical protein
MTSVPADGKYPLLVVSCKLVNCDPWNIFEVRTHHDMISISVDQISKAATHARLLIDGQVSSQGAKESPDRR